MYLYRKSHKNVTVQEQSIGTVGGNIMKNCYTKFLEKRILLLIFLMCNFLLFCGCSSELQESKRESGESLGIKIPVKRTKMFDIPSANILDIKIFIYEQIVQDNIDFGPVDYRKKEYRLIREADFNKISSELQRRFPGIKLVHGQRPFLSADIDKPNVTPSKINDGLDYSHSYIYKNNVELWQIQYIKMSEDGQEIEVYVTRYRSGMDASGTIYLFKKKGEMWYFKEYKCNWFAFLGRNGNMNA